MIWRHLFRRFQHAWVSLRTDAISQTLIEEVKVAASLAVRIVGKMTREIGRRHRIWRDQQSMKYNSHFGIEEMDWEG